MTLDVAHAEYAGGGPGYALVRLTGRARVEPVGPAGAAVRLAPPTLLIADGTAWRRLAPVPGTPLIIGEAPFTVAFEVPLHLALGAGAWWLEPGPAIAEPGRAGDAPERTHVDALAARVAALGAEVAGLRERVEAQGAQAPERASVPDDRAPATAPAPAPAGPSPHATSVPRASRLRALRPTLPALLVAAGALAVTDAVATVAWQEPVSAVWAAHEQHALEGDLARLDAAYSRPAPAPTATPGGAPNGAAPTAALTTPASRIRTLARTLERRAQPTEPIGKLRIARLHTSFVVVQGTGGSSLRRGPGHYLGTALPGQPGTVGIAGHRTTYGAPFRHLDALRRGDAITITMPYGRFVYRVEGTRIVRPEDVSSLRSAGRQRLALTACHPLYSAAQRLVVLADLESATPRGAAAATGAAGTTA
jgi:sortase A